MKLFAEAHQAEASHRTHVNTGSHQNEIFPHGLVKPWQCGIILFSVPQNTSFSQPLRCLYKAQRARESEYSMLLGHELTITFAYAVSLSRKLKSSDDNTIIIPLYYHNNTIILPLEMVLLWYLNGKLIVFILYLPPTKSEGTSRHEL